jgi:hypothetical protein
VTPSARIVGLSIARMAGGTPGDQNLACFLRMDVTREAAVFTPFKVSGMRGEIAAERIEDPIEVPLRGTEP